MLTSYQASPIAYWADAVEDVEPGSGPYCGDCADQLAGGLEESGEHDELLIHYYRTPAGFQPTSRYGVEEAFGCSGVECERCGDSIVEPDHSWLELEPDGGAVECPDCGTLVEPEELEGDPNPPAPRWVPCPRCGAGDGEPHRETCPEVTA